MMTTIEFNINNYVMVKLTETGIQELKRQHDELAEMFPSIKNKFKYPVIDENGYTKYQMHELMNKFGHIMMSFCDLPFEASILIEEKQE